MVTMSTIPVGQKLNNRYNIIQHLKTGGMSEIYLAEDQILGNRVLAIKRLVYQPGDQEGIELFDREAQVLASLDHPSIVKVSDYFLERQDRFLVMEYVVGQNLEDIVASSPGNFIEERQVIEWSITLCKVLNYLHTQKTPIVFRDLKPANVMLANQGSIKLIDFGITRFFKNFKTTDTVAIGTEGYCPPEQYEKTSGQTGPYSDIFALGATMHHLLSGRDPRDHAPFSFPPLSRLKPSISPGLETTVAKALELPPANRFQKVYEMQRALADALALLSSPPCPSCNHLNDPSLIFCDLCAQQLRPDLRNCTSNKCHGQIPVGSAFCSSCGSKQH